MKYKSFSELIDSLTICNIKLFFLIERVNEDKHTREDASKIQKLNSQRSQLKNAINEKFNEEQEVKV